MKRLSLIPFPSHVEQYDGSFLLAETTRIVVGSSGAADAAALLSEYLSASTGYPFPVCSGHAGSGDIYLVESGDNGCDSAGFVSESYELSVRRDGICLRGLNRESVLSGIQTLRQLFPPEIYSPVPVKDMRWEACCVEIRDNPRFRWRGMMIDVSRHFFPKEHIFRMIELFAQYRFNRVHLHLSDDQGWRIEIKKYPLLTEVGSIRPRTVIGHVHRDVPRRYDETPYGGFFSQIDVADIVEFAYRRGIVIVPEIDMPGHMVAAIASYPEWGNFPECRIHVRDTWDISYQILSPRESTIEAMENILGEVMDLFPGKFIHLGGDEARKDEWIICSEVQKIMASVGVRNETELQAWFLKRVNSCVTQNGRRMIGWDEIMDGGLPENAAVMCWRGEDFARKADKHGVEFVAAYNTYTYLDYFQADPEHEPLGIGGDLPAERVYRFDPVLKGMLPDAGSRALGGQGQLWAEYIGTPEHMEYMAFPRACALAEKLWTPPELCNFVDFTRRLSDHRSRFAVQNVNAHPLP